jgi:hypothetical protein
MKYAMPVHPKVLEQDYKTEPVILFDILNLTKKLKEIESLENLKKENKIRFELLLKILNKFLAKTWYEINFKKGINLKNREKLVPLFKEMNRLFAKGVEYYPPSLYRGVRLSRVLGPTALRDTYPNSINDPVVLEHLESLAYGLRSWTKDVDMAQDWAKGVVEGDGESAIGRDLVIFQIQKPKIILDADKVIDYYYENLDTYTHMFDTEEVVLNVKNPKVLEIKRYSHEPKIYHVVIKDR